MFSYRSVKLTVLTLVMMLFVTAANAVPAKPGQKRQLTLANGTIVSALLVGDEHGHYWLADDGKAYQDVNNSNVFQLIDKQAINEKARERRMKVNQQRAKRLPGRHNEGTNSGYIGDKKGLIILVNFSDKSFNASNNNARYQDIANKVNYSSGKFVGSVHDYFYAQSEGKFNLTFDVVGPVTLSQKMSYYGGNDSQGNDKHPAQMVIEALNLVNDDVNFADYDWNGDGEVDQVFIIYAGYGEANGGASNTIWPHEWNLYEASYYGDGSGIQRMDGVKINTYACGSELSGSGQIDGIGTICHEFSHCLGYPDFYDTDYSGGQGMGEWDLMDSGCYNGDGFRPAGYTSYERWVGGWHTPIELVNTHKIEGMKALHNGGDSYIIYNNGNRNEYFLLENRQKTGWDTSLPGKGLLIIHVDYDANVWAYNQPNDDPSHQRMTWIAADNEYQYYIYNGTKYYTSEGMSTDTYPYGSNNSFSKESTPAAKFYNKNTDGTYFLDSSLEDIKQNGDGTISFMFRGISNVATPVFTPNAGRYEEAQTVAISCETEGASIFYTLDGSTPTASSIAYTEPFVVSETTTVMAIAVKDGEESLVAKAKYTIGVNPSNPDALNFKLVTSTNNMEEGMRYIIARDDKAAGALTKTSSSNYLSRVEVETADDIIVTSDDVSVFIVEEMAGGWSFKNEATGKYLIATSAKKLAYVDEPKAWKLNTNDGVTMTFGDYGTMLYNVNTPRFTTYTSDPSTSMLLAHLYMETEEGPVHKKDVEMAFSIDNVVMTLGEEFTEPTLTINPENLPVTYTSSNTSVATVNAETGKVTIENIGTTEIIATFAGDEVYNEASAAYLIKVKKPAGPAEEGSYELVTDASVLDAGQQVMIAVKYNDNILVMSTTQNTNNRAATDDVIVNDNETLEPGAAAQIITLEKDGDYFLFSMDEGYLYAASSNSNKLCTKEIPDDNAKATISIDAEGLATIAFQGNVTRNLLRFNPNNGNPIFSCYDVNSTVKTLPMIYRQVIDNPSTGIATVKQDQAAPVVYNLQGQRVNGRMLKGIYIVNGRKVMK